MKRIMIFSMLIVALLSGLTSCEDRLDGDWDEMLWSCREMPLNDGHVTIPAEGDTLHISCTNYNGVWFVVDGNFKFIDENDSIVPDSVQPSFLKISNGWIKAVILPKQPSDITVTIQPNTTGAVRRDSFTVTAGDIFHEFVFTQEAK